MISSHLESDLQEGSKIFSLYPYLVLQPSTPA
jgi:hypothetical protein